ncbi:hypothetical protein O9H85_32765 [Paenibacillus filicis]|uniref:Uncharacterized protein n=1 Tax=Paenibacillus gyeongsangnamensis TaxID=3388067 RepID=A0ABT4QK19_9BACL|nr:hypothetical protein [Paenibacillus filicis]MCZ8517045.1 hypothetical protein [Paenibacillus filicis]
MQAGKKRENPESVEFRVFLLTTLNPGDGIYFNSLEEHLVIPISQQVKYMAVFTEHQAKSYDNGSPRDSR